MSYRMVDSLTPEQVVELHELYQGEWWSKGRTSSDVRTMLAHTGVVIGLIDEGTGRLAAFARVLTDRVYKAIVFDVIVHPDQRGGGMGRRIMDAIVEHPMLRRVQTIELYCLPELAPFYAQWGFTADLAGCVFLRRPTNVS